MVTIEMQKECGCFKKSNYENLTRFETKEDAMSQARLMENYMNREFCKKHFFTAKEHGDKITIEVQMRPQEDSKNEGCCGGGHCS